MIVAWGNYRHSMGQVKITIEKSNQLDGKGLPNLEENRWNLYGRLGTQGMTQAQLMLAISALEAAYSQQYQDLIVYLPDGTTKTPHQLLNASCVGGTRIVKPPSFPEGNGPEGVTLRHYSIDIIGIKPIAAASALVSFKETIEREGGGAMRGMMETLDTEPVEQLLRQATIYRAIQQGNAVGLYGPPDIPPPIWPDKLVRGFPKTSEENPDVVGSTEINFRRSWVYVYESSSPMYGSPHRW